MSRCSSAAKLDLILRAADVRPRDGSGRLTASMGFLGSKRALHGIRIARVAAHRHSASGQRSSSSRQASTSLIT